MAERTLVIVKPDGVQRALVGPILGRLEGRGLKLVALKLMAVPQSLAEKHYEVHKDKPFYGELVAYITSGPVIVAVLEGRNAVAAVRAMLGGTDSAAAAAGTMRGDWALDVLRNLVHASDSPETGRTEVDLWFSPADIVEWQRDSERWISEL